MRELFHYKLGQIYYKPWQLLQKVTFITECVSSKFKSLKSKRIKVKVKVCKSVFNFLYIEI